MKKRRNKIQNTWLLLITVYLLTMGIIALTKKLNIYIALIAFIIVIFIFLKYKKWKEKRFLTSSFKIIDNMTGEEFEEFLQLHFKRNGYKASLTPLKADYGADIVLKKSGERIVVQAKRWNQVVGIEAVQQAVASIKYYRADSAMVVTNNYFTENAKNLADANNVKLIDRHSLTDLIKDKESKCPLCDGEIKIKKGQYGNFYGCSNYPKCKYTKST